MLHLVYMQVFPGDEHTSIGVCLALIGFSEPSTVFDLYGVFFPIKIKYVIIHKTLYCYKGPD